VSKPQRDRDRARSKAKRREEYFATRRKKRQKRLALVLAAVLALSGLGTAAILMMESSGNATGNTSQGESTDANNPCPQPTDVVAEPAFQRGKPPSSDLAEDRKWSGTLTTSCGDIDIELDGKNAPHGVASFVSLASEDFYNNTQCHRLTTEGIFVLQCGDPTGKGTGGPGYTYGPIENAPEDDVYPAGTLAMARQGGDGDSMGSQFFITYEDSTIPADDAGGYTVLGQVTSGLDVVRTIAEGGLSTNGVAPHWPIAIEKVALK